MVYLTLVLLFVAKFTIYASKSIFRTKMLLALAEPSAMKRIKWIRRVLQLLVIAGLCLLPWLNAAGWRGVSGSFFALDFGGLPFADPVAAAQVAAMQFLKF